MEEGQGKVASKTERVLFKHWLKHIVANQGRHAEEKEKVDRLWGSFILGLFWYLEWRQEVNLRKFYEVKFAKGYSLGNHWSNPGPATI